MMKKKPDSPLFRLPRLHLCPPLVKLVKFVVFHIYSPPPCQIISSLRPSPAPSPSLSTIRDIREIRSLSNTLPSFGGVGGGPLHPYRVYRFYMCSPLVQLVKFVVL